MASKRRVEVIYYLSSSKDTSHEQPHLIDVVYSATHGLLLKDFKTKLASIRGKAVPELFCWSYKRNYKKDFIWHDVLDDDVIFPTRDAEYILKGFEILDDCRESPGEIHNKGVLKVHPRVHPMSKQLVNEFESSHPAIEENVFTTLQDDIDIHSCTANSRNLHSTAVNEVVRVYKRRQSSEDKNNDATTQTEDETEGQHKFIAANLQNSRTEKPLVAPHQKKSYSAANPRPEKKKIQSVVAIMDSLQLIGCSDDVRKPLRMLACGNIDTRVQNAGSDSGTAAGAPAAEAKVGKQKITGGLFSRWMPMIWRREYKSPVSAASSISNVSRPSYDTGARLESRVHMHENNNQSYPGRQQRHSFSNGDYGNDRVRSVGIWENEQRRLSSESFYEVDWRRNSSENSKKEAFEDDESSSSRMIAKLVHEANNKESANKIPPSWWEEVEGAPVTRLRKSKLDWEQNLREAVNMIIRPHKNSSN